MRRRPGYGTIAFDVLIGKVPCRRMDAVDEGVNCFLKLACAAKWVLKIGSLASVPTL